MPFQQLRSCCERQEAWPQNTGTLPNSDSTITVQRDDTHIPVCKVWVFEVKAGLVSFQNPRFKTKEEGTLLSNSSGNPKLKPQPFCHLTSGAPYPKISLRNHTCNMKSPHFSQVCARLVASKTIRQLGQMWEISHLVCSFNSMCQ